MNSSKNAAIITPIISPPISPLEMPVWEPKLTSGGDDRVVGEEGGVVGGEEAVVGGEEGIVGGEVGVVGEADVVVVMAMAQSGAARLSNSIKQVGSMW